MSTSEIISILLSVKFILTYIVSFSRTGVSFYYSNQMKLLGMNLINDDRFISQCTFLAFVVNLTVRLSVGRLYAWFGFNALYFIQITSNFLCSFILFFWGTHKAGFLCFMLIQRVCSGKTD